MNTTFIPRYREEEYGVIVSLPDGNMDFYDKSCLPQLRAGDYDNLDKYKFFNMSKILRNKRKGNTINYFSNEILRKDNPLKAPISASIELTTECNLYCPHCSVKAGKKREFELTTEQVKKIIMQLKDAEVMSVFFTGGECTLRNDFVELCNYVAELDIDCFVQTNGLNLTSKILESISKKIYFVISFDGIEHCGKLHPSNFKFEQYDELFKMLRRYEFPFSVQYVAYKDNLKDLPKTYEYCQENKIDMGALDLFATGRALINRDIFPTIDQMDDFKKIAKAKYVYEKAQQVFEKEIFKNAANPYHFAFIQKLQEIFEKIYSGVFAAYISSNGDVYPDVMHAGEEMFKAGNILENDFLYLWNNSFTEIREIVKWKHWEHCKECKLSNQFCDFKLPVLSYNLHKKYTYCGAPDTQIEIMNMRYIKREEAKTAFDNDKAREIDFW